MSNSINAKEQLYYTFLKRYGNRFDKIPAIIQYLNTYPAVFTALKIKKLINHEEVSIRQKEWVWLVSNFKGQEKDHFKPYWFPIEKEGYDFFIDLSNEHLPLFESTFYIFEPYGYFNTVLFNSINDLMLSIENNIDFFEHYNQHFRNRFANFEIKSKERNRLIFEGKITVDPIDIFEVTVEDELLPLMVGSDLEFYTVTGVNVKATVCGLLPYNLPVSILTSGFDTLDNKFLQGFDFDIIRTMKDFIHVLRMYRPENLLYYTALIGNSLTDTISYRNLVFELKTSDCNLMDAFVKAYTLLLPES